MNKPRIVIANVHYEPWSYGGATVVVEAMAQRLAGKHGWNVLVVTTFSDTLLSPYTVKRYRANNVDVVAVCIPPQLRFAERYENPKFDEVFKRIVAAYAPDVAHIHCIQNMGAGFFGHLKELGIPFAVTIHDAWWWCERQFMVMENGSYCHQVKIDHSVCRFCVPEIGATRTRQKLLLDEIKKADLLLFPSDYFRGLAVANGMPAEICRTNKNGILPPGSGFKRTKRAVLRFGFVGGPGPNKGAKQILQALRAIKRTDYELVIVDAAQNVGRTWRNEIDWTVPGELRFHPGYNASSIDGFFQTIDVLLFPSLWKESFGLTVREALVRDVWVIASDAGGVAEDCASGENSTVIAMSSNPAHLRKALENILENPIAPDFKNPRKAGITTCDDQAGELAGMLKELVAKKAALNRRA